MTPPPPRTAAELIALCEQAVAEGQYDFHTYLSVLGPHRALPLLKELAALRAAAPPAPVEKAEMTSLKAQLDPAEAAAFIDAIADIEAGRIVPLRQPSSAVPVETRTPDEMIDFADKCVHGFTVCKVCDHYPEDHTPPTPAPSPVETLHERDHAGHDWPYRMGSDDVCARCGLTPRQAIGKICEQELRARLANVAPASPLGSPERREPPFGPCVRTASSGVCPLGTKSCTLSHAIIVETLQAEAVIAYLGKRIAELKKVIDARNVALRDMAINRSYYDDEMGRLYRDEIALAFLHKELASLTDGRGEGQ